jgi:hypothetical protein
LVFGAATVLVLQHRANTRLREQLRSAEAALAASMAAEASQARSRDTGPERPVVPPDPMVTAQPRRSLQGLMQQAIAMTSRPGSREETVKEIEPLLAQIPLADL